MKTVLQFSVRLTPHQLGQITFIREHLGWHDKKSVDIIRDALKAYAQHLHEENPDKAAEWWSFT